MERTLERPQEYFAFGSVVEDHPQSTVTSIVLRGEVLANLGDIRDLPIEDVIGPLLDSFHCLCLAQKAPGVADTALEVLLYRLEQVLIAIEVLAFFAMLNLLSSTLFGASADMA